MKTSCGIIIINQENEIFLCHVTGQKHNDIPKGVLDDAEEPINCAIRECEEETSLKFETNQLTDLGIHKYLKDKNLHLFLIKVDKNTIDLNALKCESYFEHFYTKKMVPEVDGFNWFSLDNVEEHTAKNMGKLLLSIKDNFNRPSKKL